jgi:SAM-dependent MidA family methyltransferase
MNLREKIEQEIRNRGPIPFSRYMQLCLYDPELGYYARNSEKFGKAGDYYTSSDVHAVFGRLLARQFEEMWHLLREPPHLQVVELGPGRGLFARDVLDWSEKKFPEFFEALTYMLVESSPSLEKRLQTTIERHLASGKARLDPRWLEEHQALEGRDARPSTVAEYEARNSANELAISPTPLVVFANEFFDALPVEVLSEKGSLGIDVLHGKLVEIWTPPSPAELEFLDRYGIHPEAGQRTEAMLVAVRQMAEIAERVERGFVVVVDYGYTRDEQLAGRHCGTIMAYSQHQASTNPYAAPGEQDITAHVNFSALAAVAKKHGLDVQRLLTQSQFLMGIGETSQFADAFEDCRLPQERAKVALQLKHLVTPAGMGETFHVLLASKGVSADEMSKLSGLSFGQGRISDGANSA